MCDFHTHTFLSDGELSPLELIRRAVVNGYQAIAITDHAGPGELERFIKEISIDCALAEKYWDIRAIPGIEITHLPPEAISDVAREAKEKGAKLVVVHGESVVEPVEKGTNAAAAGSPHVDILAHPGMLTENDARTARSNGLFLEITARKGHSQTNEHVAKVACAAGAKLILSSDAHNEEDLLSEEMAIAILRGSGLDESAIEEVLQINPNLLMDKLQKK
ncbi:MAG: histidinol phosphate phosphatase domain-containing protein [Planctomycetes bacterium]|nr:histidinol phosphate phosphatase domain-containing protein [Planctomycetota bacterium]